MAYQNGDQRCEDTVEKTLDDIDKLFEKTNSFVSKGKGKYMIELVNTSGYRRRDIPFKSNV